MLFKLIVAFHKITDPQIVFFWQRLQLQLRLHRNEVKYDLS